MKTMLLFLLFYITGHARMVGSIDVRIHPYYTQSDSSAMVLTITKATPDEVTQQMLWNTLFIPDRWIALHNLSAGEQDTLSIAQPTNSLWIITKTETGFNLSSREEAIRRDTVMLQRILVSGIVGIIALISFLLYRFSQKDQLRKIKRNMFIAFLGIAIFTFMMTFDILPKIAGFGCILIALLVFFYKIWPVKKTSIQ